MDEILHGLDCNQKEINTYKTLLNLGISNVSQISRETKLPRQTIYYLLESLINKGLIEQTIKRGVKYFAADPFKIRSVITKKKRQLEENRKRLDEEIVKLMSKNGHGTELPRIQFYQGQEGLKRLLTNILDLHRRTKYKTFRAYGINEYYPGMSEFIENFVEEREKLGVKSKIFLPQETDFAKLGGKNTHNREFKTLNIDYHKAALYLIGNRIYIFSYKDGLGVMIENNSIANFLKDIFDERWEKTI